jgi:hypothetical protein
MNAKLVNLFDISERKNPVFTVFFPCLYFQTFFFFGFNLQFDLLPSPNKPVPALAANRLCIF